MTRLLGVLLMVLALYAVLLASSENARTWSTQSDIADRLGFYGILTVGVAVLIISGGIDLSIGSVVGLGAVCYGLLIQGPLDRPAALGIGRTVTVALVVLSDVVIYRLAITGRRRLLLRGSAPRRATALVITAAAFAGLLTQVGAYCAGAVCYRILWGHRFSPWEAVWLVVAGSAVIGLCHGLLVTKLRLQPFLVTLCGLFIYRGVARSLSSSSVGLGVKADPGYLDQIEQV